MNKNKLQQEIFEWANKTFNQGKFTKERAIAISYHLQKESVELTGGLKEYFLNSQTPQSLDKVAKELADNLILCLEIGKHLGMNVDDMFQAARDKFEICKTREWGEPDENGVIEHIKREEDLINEKTNICINCLIKPQSPGSDMCGGCIDNSIH